MVDSSTGTATSSSEYSNGGGGNVDRKRNNRSGARNQRGRGGQQGNRQIGLKNQSRPFSNHKVDMRKYEKMIGEHESNFSDVKLGGGPTEECTICWKPADIFGTGSCRHPVCLECAIRIRVLANQRSCPVCRGDLPIIYFVFVKSDSPLETRSLSFALNEHPDEHRYGIRFESLSVGDRYEKYLAHVCRYCTSPDDDNEKLEFPTFVSLRQHMVSVHHRSYCHICTDNLSLLSRERRTYTRDELQRHIKDGDADDKSVKGHPMCLFCDQRFFDNDGQYRHLRKDHFFCQFCEADGTAVNLFFGTHEELLKHYKAKHFLCENPECKQLGIAFANQFEFNLHRTQHDKKKVQLDFRFSDRQIVGHARTRRDDGVQPSFVSPTQQNERIAVIPAPAPSPPVQQRPTQEVVVVRSAQSRGPIRYHKGPQFVSQMDDFPSLGSSSSLSPVPYENSELPPRKSEFPRLNKVGRQVHSEKEKAKLVEAKKQRAVEEFPSLNGSTPVVQPKQEWGKHSEKFEVIDDDEQAVSLSLSSIKHSAMKSSTSLQKPNIELSQTPKPVTSMREDFPSLPTSSSRQQITPNWSNSTKSKNVIVGVTVPKKSLPQPDLWPERCPRSPQLLVQEEESHGMWKEIPVKKPKKLTKKERKERQKTKERLDAQELEQEKAEFQKKMLETPDYDIEMQKLLLSDIEAVKSNSTEAPHSLDSKNTSHQDGSGCASNASQQTNSNVIKEFNNEQKNGAKPKKKRNKDAANSSENDSKNSDMADLKSQLDGMVPQTETHKRSSEVASEPGGTVIEARSGQPTGISSWFMSSVSSVFSNLSLSNVLGNDSTEKSGISNNDVKTTTTATTSPISIATEALPLADIAPPGLSGAKYALPPGLSRRTDPFFPPPGFENIKPVPPTGLASNSSSSLAQNDFSSAPFLSIDDLKKTSDSATFTNSNGWAQVSGKASKKKK